MSFGNALTQRIISHTAVSTLIGTRCYPDGQVPQKATYPYVTYKRIGGTSDYHLAGLCGIASELWQIDVFAYSRQQAREVGRAMQKTLGFVSSESFGTYRVYSCIQANRFDDETADKKGKRVFINTLEYQLRRTEVI